MPTVPHLPVSPFSPFALVSSSRPLAPLAAGNAGVGICSGSRSAPGFQEHLPLYGRATRRQQQKKDNRNEHGALRSTLAFTGLTGITALTALTASRASRPTIIVLEEKIGVTVPFVFLKWSLKKNAFSFNKKKILRFF
jgi:hypothetical protein